MSKLVLVYGGESTGTRLMTKMLIEGLGFYGDSGHVQRLDKIINQENCRGFERDILIPYRNSGIVWRRSFPHNRVYIDVEEELTKLVPKYFYSQNVRVLVMTRNWMAAARSQVRMKHVDNIGHAMANLQNAYRVIFKFLSKCHYLRYHIVSFDLLVQRPAPMAYLPYLFKELGFIRSRMSLMHLYEQIVDTNEKHIWEVIGEQEKATGSADKPPSAEEEALDR